MYRICFSLLMLSLLCMSTYAQKRALDHDVYEIWNSISDREISHDGQWIFYEYSPEKGDGTLEIRSLTDNELYKIPRGDAAQFTHNSQYVVYLITPPDDTLRAARKADLDEDEMPKDTLGILDLGTGVPHYVPHVRSFEVPDEFTNVVAYLSEETEADSTGKGSMLHVHDLGTTSVTSFAHVQEYLLSANGAHLVYTFEGNDSLDTGLVRVDLYSGAVDTLLSGGGAYKRLTFDEAGDQLAFLSSREGHAMDPAEYALYYWRAGTDSARAVATATSDALAEGWWISPDRDPSFSESGDRLYFGTAPKPAAEKEEVDEEETPVLDIWNWRDPLLQPMQLVNMEREKERSYLAVLHLDTEQIIQLARKAMPNVSVGSDGDANIALGWSNLPYQQQISWDSPRAYDAYVVNVLDGTGTLVLEGVQYLPSLSPDAGYITWWNRDELSWMALPTEGGQQINLTASIEVPIHNEIHDWPYAPNPYGSVGWSADDHEFLFYDRHDIWAVNPSDVSAHRNVTGGLGREQDLQFRYVELDPDEESISDELMLSAFNMETKTSGFYRGHIDSDGRPEELVMMDKRFGSLDKAEDAGQLLFTRESFTESRDLWTSSLDLSDMKQVSDVNPQQSDYSWGTAELVHWTSLDGIPLTGMLFKPDGFDASQKYPMMVYFYEKMSNSLHQYRPPTTARSSISFSFYVSRGYVVFVPDIPYKVGYPGESALNAVVPGVTMLINRGFVDPDRVGVQGHSWGGYQIAYMITESDLFAAAEAGAPVVNMTSAYGGIRWASGMSRMFQYERTQSRIGGSLWETPIRYLDNSPLFQADKIKTPVLMLHNDDDGAVPWYQGIEFFVALRRLQKPVWMLNYNGEGHGLSKYPNRRDFAIRMQQFFDHYLMDAPAPVWMTEGVPATMKGETLGLEPAEDQ
ncbi:MAG: prolyl oligopeptidase family serine peptidase [Bacteroidota bacterium]|nr:prolyl oligopeptidase family serine peptidase [Bacteroidota bacterium]MXW13531.1 S9 family peptidase [Rhodothermaceae bacterium]MDE2646563.1 prolyl oligopeptidase family serine peptidase [Bacteroidota bacterium]MXW33475.1 S9 family peptidase [Rhodothermaceae bacterium]MYC04829.1 S9 family peptidase [Rhodothermaceae bacterium]